jgi:uncharacterized protein YecT (DUF1311 family)
MANDRSFHRAWILGGAAFISAGLLAGIVFAQQSSSRDARKQEADGYLARHDQLVKKMKAAYQREFAREKVGECPDAATTFAIVSCLDAQAKTSNANLDEYVKIAEELLAPDGPAAVTGPAGSPLTGAQDAERLKRTEVAWRAYNKAACDGAYGLYEGGTLAPIAWLGCDLSLTRNHLRDLDAVYGEYFSH